MPDEFTDPPPSHSLPQPLARMLLALDSESNPFRRAHRLIDALEVFVKLHTVVIVSDYFQRTDVSDALRGLLGAGLRKPSLGIWWQFARDIAAHMEQSGMEPVHPELAKAVRKKGLLFRLLEGNDNFITFRNGYAHGATPPDAKCQADLAKYEPRLRAAIAAAGYLSEPAWFGIGADATALPLGGRPADPLPEGLCPAQVHLQIQPTAVPLSLHPLLVLHPDSGEAFFYNDLRSNAAAFLNYADCEHWRDRLLREALLDRYPLDEWRGLAPDDFRQRIEELTETFKGRRHDIRDLLAFVRHEQPGIRMVWGPPGAGKSALLARALQILRWPLALRQREGFDHEDDPAIQIEVIEFFVWRGQQETTSADYLLRNLSDRLERHFNTGIQADCQNIQDRLRLFNLRLEKAAASLKPDQRLVLFIDGLDEAAENSGFLESLPRHVPGSVKLIYASRPHSSVEALVYENLDREQREGHPLSGLGVDDIRALLHDHVNKYAIPPGYVERLAERSAGNPLFAKLVCLGLETGDYTLDNLDAIPGKLEDIYATLCKRLRTVSGAHRLLILLAEARDYLSPSLCTAILEVDVGILEANLLPACAEVLTTREQSTTNKAQRYQLFHESLREYLRSNYADDCLSMQNTLAHWCARWQDYNPGSEAERYAVLNLAPHLDLVRQHRLANDRPEAAEALADSLFSTIDSESFRTRSVLISGNFTALRRDLKLAQRAAIARDTNGSESRRIFTYARLFHEEFDRLYARQLQQLDKKAAAGDWDAVCDIAHIAQSPDQQGLLLLRAVLAAGLTTPPPTISKELQSLAHASGNPTWEALSQTSAH